VELWAIGFVPKTRLKISAVPIVAPSGITPNGECHDNIKSLAMVFAVVESSKAGRRVKLSEIL